MPLKLDFGRDCRGKPIGAVPRAELTWTRYWVRVQRRLHADQPHLRWRRSFQIVLCVSDRRVYTDSEDAL